MMVEIFSLGQNPNAGQVVSGFCVVEMPRTDTMRLDVLLLDLCAQSVTLTRSTQMRGRASHYTGPIDRDDSSDSAYVTLLIRSSLTHCLTVFTSLRMYAIWYKNRKIFGVVLLLGVVPIGVNMVRSCQDFSILFNPIRSLNVYYVAVLLHQSDLRCCPSSLGRLR